MQLRKILGLTLVVLFIFGLASFGSSVTTPVTTQPQSDDFGTAFDLQAVIEEDANNDAMLRVAHLSSDAPAVDVLVNGSKAVDSAPYRAVTDYLPLDPDYVYNFTVVVQDTTTRAFDPVITPLAADTYYTVAAVGLLGDGSIHPEIYVDDNSLSTGAENAKFRAIHTVPDVGLVDVNLTDGTPLVTSLDYNDSSDYLIVPAGSYDVAVYPDGSSTAAIGPVTLNLYAGYIYSIFAIGTADTNDDPLGALDLLVVVDDTGAADVRVTHAVPDAPTVDVLVNGSTAFDVLGFTQTTGYASLDLVNPSNGDAYDAYNFTVIQTGTTSPAVIGPVVTPLENDTDYTIAAVGNLSTIEPIILEDDNSPVDQGNARVRVAHLSPNAPAVDITLSDGTVLVSNLAFKEAGYIEVPAGTYDLQVRAAGTDVVVLDLAGTTLEEGSVYSVFAMGYLLLPDTVTETVVSTTNNTVTETVTSVSTTTEASTQTVTETAEASGFGLLISLTAFAVATVLFRRFR